jgi:hypothetical protein
MRYGRLPRLGRLDWRLNVSRQITGLADAQQLEKIKRKAEKRKEEERYLKPTRHPGPALPA